MKITIVSGFLGSGKTTYLRALLKKYHNDCAVVINEYADISVDDIHFSGYREIHSISGGSIFCSCKLGNFYNTIKDLASREIKEVIVETSGFANLNSIEKIIDHLTNEFSVRITDTICLVDPSLILKWLKVTPTATSQLAKATKIVINKIDLVDQNTLTEVCSVIRRINIHARIVYALYGDAVDVNQFQVGQTIDKREVKILTTSLTDSKLILNIGDALSLEILSSFLLKLKGNIYRAKGTILREKYLYIDLSDDLRISETMKPSEDRLVNKIVILFDSNLITKSEILESFDKFICNNNY